MPRWEGGRSGMSAHTSAVDARTILERTSFLGRKAELARLVELRATARLLTLAGTGGLGKSRLAIRLASALRDRIPWFVIDVSQLSGPGQLGVSVAGAAGAVRASGT